MTNYTAPLPPLLEAAARAMYVSQHWSASITEPDQELKPKAHYNALAGAHWDSGHAGYSRYATYRSLAEVAGPVIVAAAKASALRSAANDPAMRLSGHSGVSVRKLHTRANTLEKATS